MTARAFQLESARRGPAAQAAPRLTPRQRQVLLRIARGGTERALACELRISVDTVRYHKRRIFAALSAESSLDAVVKALRAGCIGIEEL